MYKLYLTPTSEINIGGLNIHDKMDTKAPIKGNLASQKYSVLR